MGTRHGDDSELVPDCGKQAQFVNGLSAQERALVWSDYDVGE